MAIFRPKRQSPRVVGETRYLTEESHPGNAWAFFIALVGGGFFVWMAKTYSDNAWVPASIAVLVVFLLVAYYALNRDDAREEEGDNVYYLGLLFTLLSLIFALIEIFGTGTSRLVTSEDIRTLLENFGIALTSTVAGICGRVLVQNVQVPTFFRRRSTEQGPGSSGDLFFDSTATMYDQSTNTAGTPIYPAGSPGSGSSRLPAGAVPAVPSANASASELQEFNRQLLSRIARDLEQGASALARFHLIVRRHASDVDESLRQHSETLRQESVAFRDTLQKNATEFAEELQKMSQASIASLTLSFDALAGKSQEVQNQTQASQDRYLEGVQAQLKSFHDSVAASSETILEAIKANSDLSSQQFRTTMETLMPALSRLNGEIGNFASSLSATNIANEQFSTNVRDLSTSTSKFTAELHAMNNDIKQMHSGFDTLSRMLETVQKMDERMGVSNDMEESAKIIESMGEALSSIVNETQKISAQTANATEVFDRFLNKVGATQSATIYAAEALQQLADNAVLQTEALKNEKKTPTRGRRWYMPWRRSKS